MNFFRARIDSKYEAVIIVIMKNIFLRGMILSLQMCVVLDVACKWNVVTSF